MNNIEKLKTILPRAEALSVRNAASWWQRPTAAAVVYQNFISKHRLPVWALANAQVGPGGFNPSKTIGDLLLSSFNGTELKITQLNAVTVPQVGFPAATAVQPAAQPVQPVQGGQPVVPPVVPAAPQKVVGRTLAIHSRIDGVGATTNGAAAGPLTAANYAQKKIPLWVTMYFRTLLGKVETTGEEAKYVSEKLAKIETIANKYFPNDDAIENSVFSVADLQKDVEKLFNPKKMGSNEQTLEGDAKTFEDQTLKIKAKLDEGSAAQSATSTDISTTTRVRTTLLSWPAFIQGLAQRTSSGAAVPYTVSDPDIPDLVSSIVLLHWQHFIAAPHILLTFLFLFFLLWCDATA